MSGMRERAVTRIEVDGFRSLKSVALDLGRLTVLIGPNGAGKSNLLTVLQMIPQIRTKNLQNFVQYRGGAAALLHYGAKLTPRARVRLEFSQEGGDNAYEVRLAHGAGDRLTIEEEYAFHRAPGVSTFKEQVVSVGVAESPLERLAREGHDITLRTVNWWLSQLNFFHFHDTSISSALRQNAAGTQSDYLGSEGQNLAAFLYRLKMSTEPDDQAAWKRIGAIVRRIAPSVAELDPVDTTPRPNLHPDDQPASLEPPRYVRLDWKDDRGETFSVADLSDGSLRAIALVTALAQPARTLPAFISIDEPELGLHPSALALFAGLVRSVSTRCQVLLSTQSPALLDHFQPEEVVVVERVDGASTFRRLDPTQLSGWLEDYTLSELYDKNVLGGRP